MEEKENQFRCSGKEDEDERTRRKGDRRGNSISYSWLLPTHVRTSSGLLDLIFSLPRNPGILRSIPRLCTRFTCCCYMGIFGFRGDFSFELAALYSDEHQFIQISFHFLLRPLSLDPSCGSVPLSKLYTTRQAGRDSSRRKS